MIFRDNVHIIPTFLRFSRSDMQVEHCALGTIKTRNISGQEVYEIFDYCSIDEIGGKFGKDFVYIPAKASIAFLRICRCYNFIPFIIHSHLINCENGEPVSYSEQDEKYMKKFCIQAQLYNIPLCIFAVTNQHSVRFRRYTANGSSLKMEDEVIYE